MTAEIAPQLPRTCGWPDCARSAIESSPWCEDHMRELLHRSFGPAKPELSEMRLNGSAA